MATGTKGSFQPDSDVHITYEDQQKINKFARLNARMDDFKEEMKTKEVQQNELKNLEDACDDLALADDDEKVPYLFGEVFIYQSVEKTQSCLEEAKTLKQKEIEELRVKSRELQELMTDLKTQLYGKFGNHINLEADDD